MNQIQFRAIESRKGLPVIEAIIDRKPMLLHSKYDPEKEAERLIESHKDKIEKADHILFYGAGMGYHIKAFFERYPEKIASVYEPFEEVSKLLLEHISMTNVPATLLQHHIVRKEDKLSLQTLSPFKENLSQSIEIIALPSYGKWQDDQLKEFIETFKQLVDTKKGDVLSASMFSRRWTINALMNLPKVMEHPNFLIEKRHYFKGKPVIVVSAGPSLSEELENLRHIKEQGSAYIFAVGSAYKALIKANIHPDAICTYDPQNHNFTVFKDLVENQIDTIPMIYGTTVGFETLDYYKGPKLYFPVWHDKLTAQFRTDQQVYVSDATTIAIVTLQLLNLLQVSKVILVGQNFAFKKEKYYAEGIERIDENKLDASDNTATAKDLAITFEVEDVHGGKVLTNDEFRRMKNDMETCLTVMKMPVINTTNGGAAIQGTTFKPLKDVLQQDLKNKVVKNNWWVNDQEKRNVLNKSFLKKYCSAFEQFEKQEATVLESLNDLKQALSSLAKEQIQLKLKNFDRAFEAYMQNVFYETTILPIVQMAFEKLKNDNELIFAITQLTQKAEKVIEIHSTFVRQCHSIYEDIAPIVGNLILRKLNVLSGFKEYSALSGVFHYEGEWNKMLLPVKEAVPEGLSEDGLKQWYKQKKLEDKIELPLFRFVETKQKGSIMKFRFKGTSIIFYGENMSERKLQLSIMVNKESFTIDVNGNKKSNIGYVRKSIFSLNNLKSTIHEIEIEILSNSPHFLFEGIEINASGRVFHIEEVEKVKDLRVGKRIRCHYESTYNTVGKFYGLGKETNSMLPVETSSEPNGDFYYIMTDEINKNKVMIADRNIQNCISWDVITAQGLGNMMEYTEQNLPNTKIYISLLTGGESEEDKNNDWDKYIVNFSNEILPSGDLVWNWSDGAGTWTINSQEYKNNQGIRMMPVRGMLFSRGGWQGNDASRWVCGTVKNTVEHIAFRPKMVVMNNYECE